MAIRKPRAKRGTTGAGGLTIRLTEAEHREILFAAWEATKAKGSKSTGAGASRVSIAGFVRDAALAAARALNTKAKNEAAQ